ncbi:uncharacterized protein TNCV_2713331 [Trichonephila clavipes]|nr:uncharacterized protein TNCV_2713331 [Trichonephila clavipes]
MKIHRLGPGGVQGQRQTNYASRDFTNPLRMSRCKVFHTAKEMLEYMFCKEIGFDIVALPPDVDELTDEEYFDDDQLTTPSVKGLKDNV